MFIRSNTLTKSDILDALQHARSEGFDIMIDEDGIRQFRPRKFARGFQLYCESAYGPRARNLRPGLAASWDAYGVAMAYLFKLDPHAEVAWYKGREDFEDKTKRYIPRGMSAPWLAAA